MQFIFTFNCMNGFFGKAEGGLWVKILSFRNANKTKVGFIQFVGIWGTN